MAPLLRESFTFQRRGSAPAPAPFGDAMGGVIPNGDGMGGQLGAWAVLCGPFRAELRPVNGREEVMDGKLAGVQPFILTVRYCAATAGVTTEDRAIGRDGAAYDITAIQNPDMRNQWLSMVVKRGEVSDG